MSNEPNSQEPISPANPPDETPSLPALRPPESPALQPAAREEAQPAAAKNPWRILIFILQVGLFVAVVAALAALVYFGWPVVYSRYVRPVEDNTNRLAVVEITQQVDQERLAALQTQVPALAESQAGQSAVLTAQAARIQTLESAIEQQAEAQAEQAAVQATLVPHVDALAGSVKQQSAALAALQSTQTGLQTADAGQRAELERQVTLLKSLELLSRARLFLYQSNFGMAKQDLQIARDLLAGMLDEPGAADDAAALEEVVQRLDLALSRLPDYPVPASDDLDIAWQLLLGGQPQPLVTPMPPAGGELTPTPTPLAATPSGTPEATPTATPTAP